MHEFFSSVIRTPSSSSAPPPINTGQQQILHALLQSTKRTEQSWHVGPVFKDPVKYGRDMFPAHVLPDERGDSDFDDNDIASEIQATLQDEHDRQREHDHAAKRRLDPDQDQANNGSRKRGFKQYDFYEDDCEEGDESEEGATEDDELEDDGNSEEGN
jgi:hypothetical protein